VQAGPEQHGVEPLLFRLAAARGVKPLSRRALAHGLLAAFGSAALSGCGGGGRDSGGLTAAERNDAQAAMNALQNSNIPLQLVGLTTVAGLAPAACRVHLSSRDPNTFKVYVFWVPFQRTRPYSWLEMTITKDPGRDAFHLGTALPVNPSTAGKRAQARIDRSVISAHAGDTFRKPGADCQVLMNGNLRLVPNP
jgi:hypothetical protein